MRLFAVVVFICCISKLITAEPPKLGPKQEDYTGFADNFRRLQCNVEGDNLNYEWFHNGEKIKSTSPLFLMVRNHLLVNEIPATEAYQGVYQCKASNNYGALLGQKIKVAFSIVGQFRKTDDATETVDVTVGKNLKLECPPRTMSRNIYYHWGGRRDVTGAWFMPQKQHYMITEDGALLFANVKDEDIEYFNVEKNGVSCSIESKGKIKRLSFSQRFLLQETGEKNTVPFGPIIQTELKDREVASGTEFVVLRCGAVGLPTPSYSWTFTGLDGVETQIVSGKNGYELQDFNHILMITSVEVKHDGWYKCQASSSYEGRKQVANVKGRISVKGKPRWMPDGQLKDVSPTEGGGFVWSCKAFGNPNPTYSWFFNGERLSTTESYVIENGTINFKSISKNNKGLYQCNAENNFGVISSSAVLKVVPAPTIWPKQQCRVSKMNLMFLVDGSGSVPDKAFQEFKMFMQLLVRKFVVGPEATHVGVLQYSSKPRTGLEFMLGEYQTMDGVQSAIAKVVYHYGAYTYGGYAMRLANKIMNNYTRQGGKDVMVMLMDDGLWDTWEAREQSRILRDRGTQIIILDLRKDKIMFDIADLGLEFTSAELKANVEKVAKEICK